MTREELIEFLRATITSGTGEAQTAPRPQGTFMGNVASRTLTGLRLVTPDGTVFYLAVLNADDFESTEATR